MQKSSYILLVIDMYVNASAHRTATVFKALVVMLLCVALLMFSQNCSEGTVEGLKLCFGVLVPSLFPFMAISSFIVKSGLSYKIGRPFGFIMKKLFGLSGAFAPIIMLSMIGGYPVGAKGIASLVKSNTVSQKEAEKASLFAVCAGPGFIVNFVGVSLYGNASIGLIILASQIISVIIIGIAINLFDRKNSEYISDKEIYSEELPLSTAIVESAYESSKGILNICAFVVLFSAFTGIIESLQLDITTQSFVFCLLEVCSAVNMLSENFPVEAVAFAIGFGGLCVHFQIFSALGDLKINKLSFFCTRIIQGVITALLTHFGTLIFPGETAVFSTSVVEKSDFFGGTIISGITLIGVAICFLYSLKSCKQH